MAARTPRLHNNQNTRPANTAQRAVGIEPKVDLSCTDDGRGSQALQTASDAGLGHVWAGECKKYRVCLEHDSRSRTAPVYASLQLGPSVKRLLCVCVCVSQVCNEVDILFACQHP